MHAWQAHTASALDAGITGAPPRIDDKPVLTQQQARVEELRAGKYAAIIAGDSNITLLRGEASAPRLAS